MAPFASRLASSPFSSAHDGRGRRDHLPHRHKPGRNVGDEADYSPSTALSTSPPPQSHRSHSRSLSNPFPLLFGARKNPNQRDGEQQWTVAEEDGDTPDKGLSRSVSPYKQSNRSIPSGDHWTRRCMTCDHSNSFPKGRKGFRCGKCAAMNDLEPYHEQSSLQAPPHNFEMRSKRRTEDRVSLGRTRAIIDQCLESFLRNQLDHSEEHDGYSSILSQFSSQRDGPDDTHGKDDCYSDRFGSSVPWAISDIETPESANSRVINTRSPNSRSGNANSALQSGFSPNPEPSSRLCRQQSSGYHPPPSGSLRQPEFRRLQHEDDACVATNRPATIFAPVEDYILAHFDGCDSLNNSFLSVRSRHPRTASEGGESAFEPDIGIKAPTTRETPPSQLDEKSLRLGNIAENGSWWAGERPSPSRHKSTDDRLKTKPQEGARSSVSLTSPRINWPELAEWYHLILRAGESWLDKWAEMRPIEPKDPASSTRAQRWDSTKLYLVNQRIHESKLRLRSTLLRASEKLLQRPRRPVRRPAEIRFILILLENPLLYPSSGYSKDPALSTLSPSRAMPRSKSEEDGAIFTDNKTAPGVRPSQSSEQTSERTDHRKHIIKRAVGLLSNLSNECHHLLLSWFSRLSEGHFRRLVELIGSFVSYRLTRKRKRRPQKPSSPGDNNIDEFVPTYSSTGNTTPAQLHTALHREKSSRTPNSEENGIHYGDDWQVKAASQVMALLFRANYASHDHRANSALVRSASQITRAYQPLIPISSFYSTILDYYDLVADFEAWESRGGKFSFCQYSFFLSIWAKIRILEHDARRQMEAKAREAFFDSILGRSGVSQYLVLKVRRDCLVEDSLRGVSEVVGSAQQEIKKGLRIEFNGEEGVDAGGLRKEWFLLLTRDIFDPHHGLFIYDEDSQYCYFNPYCFESSEQFFLVGVLLGLAIYNSTILDVALPPFAFRKLLASSPSNSSLPTLSTPPQPFRHTLDDLAEYRPALAKGLRQLLEYDGDVEETFCQTFMVHQERYGEAVEVPLSSGGENRAVTNSNRREFVDLYVKYVLNDAVSRQFEPFKRGFFTVCGGNALYLFRPEEIELLVRGSDEPLDILSLRAVAVYEHWQVDRPDREPVVNWFWEFFAALPPKNQRKLLSFITGTDRIPAMGATNLIIRLVCLGQDSDRFPTARTCFNMVALYRYRTREKFERKLWDAVVESEGFGLK